MKKFSLLLIAGLMVKFTSAQDTTVVATGGGLSTTEIVVLAGLIFTALLVIVVYLMLNTFKTLIAERNNPQPLVKKEKVSWEKVDEKKSNFWEKLLSLKPISAEKDLELKHKYDGISELNNPVPGWFNFLFYGTIVFGVVYLFIYEVSGIGGTQRDEYLTEVTIAEAEKVASLKKLGASIDENSVKVDQTPAVIENGAVLFGAYCKSCHGEKGEGTVGPNLTDEFWLHGGSVNDIFKTIKYGVVDKGMVAWGKNMSPKNISDITNFIISIKGSNPPNPKAPQGVKMEEKEEETL